MAKLVTIFGGSGFVGRQVARLMAKEGWRVRIAVRRPDEALFTRTYGSVGQVQPVLCNIRDDLSVSAPIFQPGLNAWVMLTDEAARRLAAAHLEGVAFRDVTRYRPDGQFVRLDD